MATRFCEYCPSILGARTAVFSPVLSAVQIREPHKVSPKL